MDGDMTGGKRLIIALGLMLLTHVAHARDIDRFTDSQGTVHITNPGSKKPDSPGNLPRPEASSSPGGLLDNSPITPPADEHIPMPAFPHPENQPDPQPGVVPHEPAPFDPQPGAPVTPTGGSTG